MASAAVALLQSSSPMESLVDCDDDVLATPPIGCGKRSYHQFCLPAEERPEEEPEEEPVESIQESSPPPQKRQCTNVAETVELIDDDDDDDDDQDVVIVAEPAKVVEEDPDMIIVPDSQPDDIDSPAEESYVDASQDDDPEVPLEQTIAGAASLPTPLPLVFPERGGPYNNSHWPGVVSIKDSVCPSDVDPLAWHKFKWTQLCGETLVLLDQLTSEMRVFLETVRPLHRGHFLFKDTIPAGQQQAIMFPVEDLRKLQHFVEHQSRTNWFFKLVDGLDDDWTSLFCLLSCINGVTASVSSPFFVKHFGLAVDNVRTILTRIIHDRDTTFAAPLDPNQKWYYLPTAGGFSLKRYQEMLELLQQCMRQCSQLFRAHFNPQFLILRNDCEYEGAISGMSKVADHLRHFKTISKKCLSFYTILHWFHLSFVQLNGRVACESKPQ